MHIYEQNGVILFKDLKHVLPQFKQNTLKCETVLLFFFSQSELSLLIDHAFFHTKLYILVPFAFQSLNFQFSYFGQF
jgi:hypothetical protein